MRSNFVSIVDASNTFKSSFDGSIGLNPPSTDDEDLRSFLSFAWYNGIIDNRVFSIYISLDPKI